VAKINSLPPVIHWPTTEIQVEAMGRARGEPEWMLERRRRAFREYLRLPMPSMSDAEWRRSNVPEWEAREYIPPEKKPRHTNGRRLSTKESALFDMEPAGVLALESGMPPRGVLGRTLRAKGVLMAPIPLVAREHADLLKRWLGKIVSPASGKLEALASAAADLSGIVYIPEGIRLEQPLHVPIRFMGTGLRTAHVLVVVEENANAALLLEFENAAQSSAQCLAVVEIIVRAGGGLRFVQSHDGKSKTWEYTRTRVSVETGASLDWQFALLGNATRRAMLELDLAGAGAVGRMAGLYCASGGEHVECISWQRHAAPHTVSDFLYKGAVIESARSVWRGMVRMEPNATGADGYQANRNLMLAESARAESLPGLEILADDIRCSHGATIGTLDPAEIFYLQTRGLPEAVARQELAAGFFEPVIARFPWEAFRKRLRVAVRKKMKTIKPKDGSDVTSNKKEEYRASRYTTA
jgi:Fe-S cluster assembly protein SufD